MAEKKIVALAGFSKKEMYDLGIKNGLSINAANMLKHFNEKKLVLTVDTLTGEVKKTQLAN